jgi:hypothetical protein
LADFCGLTYSRFTSHDAPLFQKQLVLAMKRPEESPTRAEVISTFRTRREPIRCRQNFQNLQHNWWDPRDVRRQPWLSHQTRELHPTNPSNPIPQFPTSQKFVLRLLKNRDVGVQ